jgi:hypothetical protein
LFSLNNPFYSPIPIKSLYLYHSSIPTVYLLQFSNFKTLSLYFLTLFYSPIPIKSPYFTSLLNIYNIFYITSQYLQYIDFNFHNFTTLSLYIHSNFHSFKILKILNKFIHPIPIRLERVYSY